VSGSPVRDAGHQGPGTLIGGLVGRVVKAQCTHPLPAEIDGHGAGAAESSLGCLWWRLLPSSDSVDLFNEGLDLSAIDTVMMLRPTESKVLFLQQLGRGLRRHADRSRLRR
jgi:hypothetical protein